MRWLPLALGLLLLPAAARAEGNKLDLGGTVIDLRRIPKGTFAQASDPGGEADETKRDVVITRDFWLGRTPVTRGQFAKFVSDTRYLTEAEKGTAGGSGWDGAKLTQKKEFTWRNPGFPQTDDDPVVLVTFGDANAFNAWAARKTGRRVRLPTEAEWEYAARAHTTSAWYGGKTDDDALAIGWFKPNAGVGTHPVGQKKANAFGLVDMSGNVYEWCRDVYAPYPAGNAADPEATTHAGGEPERRVLRGGSWLRDPKKGRSGARYRNAPGSRNADNGFRVAVYEDEALSPILVFPTATASGAPAPLASSVPVTSTTAREPAERTNFGAYAIPPLVAGLIAMGWLAFRRRGRQASTQQGVTTTPGTDGFWVSAPELAPGTRVRYACFVAGVEVTDIVPLDGADRTFVYTGQTPSGIRIVEVITVTQTAFRGAPPPQGMRASHPSRLPPPSSAAPRPIMVVSPSIIIDEGRDPLPDIGPPRAY